MSIVTKEKKAIQTPDAPAAVGPYSQAVRFGEFVFLSGQIALDPASGKIIGDTVAAQTERIMKNIAAVLKSQGLNFESVIKTTVFLRDMGTFTEFNETYAKFLKAPYPARSTVEVSRLPKEALVEIETIACVG